MTYRYEQDRTTLMRRILRYAAQDREGMIGSLASGGKPSESDEEYVADCEMMIRDIIRMDANLGLGVFGDAAKELKRPDRPVS